MANSPYKPEDILYWKEVKTLVRTIIGTALIDAVPHTAVPTSRTAADLECEIRICDELNSRVVMLTGGARLMADRILQIIDDMDAEKDDGQ